MKNIKKYFVGRRVFITGHTGFKGSWLAFLLSEMGADVMGYALPPVEGTSHFNLLRLDEKIHHVIGDIQDASFLNRTICDFKPEFVFHLAAQALVRPSYDDPVNTFSVNILGSVNLLDAVRQCASVRSLVYITSDKCYENVEWIWGYRENDTLGGHDPYSASKAAAEMVFSSYARSFFDSCPTLGAATTRAGNVIGGGDWAVDRIIPDCIRSIKSGIPIKLRNPKATRPWQHVLEPIWGYLLLASRLWDEPLKYAGSWNFGPPSSQIRTVQEVAETIVQHLGVGEIVVEQSAKHPHEANLLQLNCDKANQHLHWHSRWNVDETLEATAVWYKAYLEGENIEDITRLQIENFLGVKND